MGECPGKPATKPSCVHGSLRLAALARTSGEGSHVWREAHECATCSKDQNARFTKATVTNSGLDLSGAPMAQPFPLRNFAVPLHFTAHLASEAKGAACWEALAFLSHRWQATSQFCGSMLRRIKALGISFVGYKCGHKCGISIKDVQR